MAVLPYQLAGEATEPWNFQNHTLGGLKHVFGLELGTTH